MIIPILYSPKLKPVKKSFYFLLILASSTLYAQNYDESKIPPYTIPDLLVGESGEKINSNREWETNRRSEILALFEEHMYGKTPDFEYKTEIFRRRLPAPKLQEIATQEEVVIDLSNQHGRIRLNMLLTLPKGYSGQVPVFVGLNFHGNHVTSDNPEVSLTSNYVINTSSLKITKHRAGESLRGKRSARWPVEMILKNGYGLATIHCGDIDPDFDDGFKNGVHALLGAQPRADQWGTIAAWAWGLSRAMDYFETDHRIDQERVAVIGHSRLGKAALWAGASDPRFALVISNNSGCGGAALSRRRIGETVEAINSNFPHWFCGNFKKYNKNEDNLPLDQHMLIALMAPRPVYVASATEDQWADPKGEYVSLLLAGQVYKLYGTEILQGDQPPPSTPVHAGKQGYHLRSGPHDITPYDWQHYLEFAENYLTKK